MKKKQMCKDCGNEIATYECIDCGEKRCEYCAEGGYASCQCCNVPQFKEITPTK